MRKYLIAGMLVVLGVALVLPTTHAQQGATTQQAIDLASSHPAFVDGLAARPGWTAAAYHSKNRYGIWHVQFWDAEGEDLGWVDLSLDRSKVYSWEAHLELLEEQTAPAEDAIRTALAANSDVMALVGSLDDVSLYVNFDYWSQLWGAYVDFGPDSLYVTLRSGSDRPLSLENLQVDRIYFENMLSYDEWFSAQEAQAISIAFQHPDISAMLRDYSGWTASGEPGEDDLWYLTFSLGDQTLLTATVQVAAGQVIEFAAGS